jgi:APA family basic amino acid/polyamine antiporter
MPESPTTDAAPEHGFHRALGPFTGATLVVGTVMGSGIFLTPSTIAQRVGGFGTAAILFVWCFCGVLSLAGALSYAELGAMFPHAGGQYIFLREAYGRLTAFLYGWMEFWVARGGSIAALAVAFARYAAYFTHADDPTSRRWTSFAAIVTLTGINYLGVRLGGIVQVMFTAAKVGALALLVVCAFTLRGGSVENWTPFVHSAPNVGWLAFFSAFGLAMIQALWAYDGWTNGAAPAEEMKDPQRNIPRALVGGTLAIIAIYLTANLAYHYVLPLDRIVLSKRVASDVANILLGPLLGERPGQERIGGGLLAAAVMASTFGAVNGLLLTGPRIFFAMSRDGLFFRNMGRLHRKYRTPYASILVLGLWASFLVLFPMDRVVHSLFGWRLKSDLGDQFDDLLTFVIFGSWVFYGLSVAAVFVLRRRHPEMPRPYRAWGYPWVPALFVITSVAFVAHTLVTQPLQSLTGVVIVLAGVPAYLKWSRTRKGLPTDTGP